jgi:hypothetical protein
LVIGSGIGCVIGIGYHGGINMHGLGGRHPHDPKCGLNGDPLGGFPLGALLLNKSLG